MQSCDFVPNVFPFQRLLWQFGFVSSRSTTAAVCAVLPLIRLLSPDTVMPTASFEIRLSSAGSERRYRVEIETFEFATRPEGQ